MPAPPRHGSTATAGRPGPATAYVGLGANLGNARGSVLGAARELAAVRGVSNLRLSPLYRSTPVDAGGPDYVNAVAVLDTTLDAPALLDELQRIEHAHGRQRPYRNAPRTLDLDLLLYGDAAMDTPRLTLPHPRMHERAFVLRPLLDLAPGMRLAQGTLEELLARCAGQALHPLP